MMQYTANPINRPKYPFTLMVGIWIIVTLTVVIVNKHGEYLSYNLSAFIIISALILIPLFIGTRYRICIGTGKIVIRKVISLRLDQVIKLCDENKEMKSYYMKYENSDPNMWGCIAWTSDECEYSFVTELHHMSDRKYSCD